MQGLPVWDQRECSTMFHHCILSILHSDVDPDFEPVWFVPCHNLGLPLASLQKTHGFIRQANRQGLERLGWPGGYALAQLLLGDSGEDLGTTLC